METKEEIGTILRTIILEKGYSIRGFATAIGVTNVQVLRVLKGQNYTIDTLLRMLDELQLDIMLRNKREKVTDEYTQ